MRQVADCKASSVAWNETLMSAFTDAIDINAKTFSTNKEAHDRLQRQAMLDATLSFRSAMVARPVPKAEMKLKPAAEEAVAIEWTKLRNVDCWEETVPRTLRSVKADAAKTMQ